ncbi:hypothetical protein [Thermomonospora umbrina]|uniref:Uncharacterized protein n=1 Tax=Thermomonospora umbrina TaxID=111806 RepID=A0A3D9T5D2_9ACTN|nr:hypothetical protein [Thermomonospora umbrina]REE99001.1 hypothetical protein DFJ69_4501 [Thermomonospora umbrina]
MHPYTSAELARKLQRTATGLLSAEAAVDLLIGHGAWLAREDFVHGFIDVATDPFQRGHEQVAAVRWEAATGAVKAGRLVCSGSEAAMLSIAASLAAGITVDLRETLGGLDAANLALVLKALARANGRAVQVRVR